MAEQLPLSDKLDLSSNASSKFRMMTAQFGDGYSQRAPDGLNNKIDAWSITYSTLTAAELATVQAFIEIVRSGEYFLFTPPGDVEKKWIIDFGSAITKKYIGGVHVDIVFKIVQVFDLG